MSYKSSKSPTSPSNHVQNVSSSMLSQHTPTLNNIQSNLNRLCSQHDSLMPLLSLLETMPQISKTSNTIKHSLKKIQALQNSLEREKEMRHISELKYQQQNPRSSILNLHSLLKQCKDNIQKLEDSLKNNDSNKPNAIQSLPEDLEQTLNSHKYSVQYLLSAAKNNIELKFKSNHFNIVLDKKYQRLIPSSMADPYRLQINNLYREIQIVNLELGERNYDLMEFHKFSCQRIKYELYEIREVIQAMIDSAKLDNIDAVARRVEMIYYQIKGLRKKYLFQLNKKAKDGKAIFQVLEQFKADLKQLQQNWNGTNSTLVKLKQIATNRDNLPSKRMKAQTQL